MGQPANTTPGPWQTREGGNGVIYDMQGRLVATVYGGNVAMVAATPELYDALFKLVAWIDGADVGEPAESAYASREYRDAIAALRRAGWTK